MTAFRPVLPVPNLEAALIRLLKVFEVEARRAAPPRRLSASSRLAPYIVGSAAPRQWFPMPRGH
ncbi:hypothetical protein BV511_15995 [Methylorubrum extorquens]|nr:hypothetical protein BV511_15995 [Methylorubrum extorquens]